MTAGAPETAGLDRLRRELSLSDEVRNAVAVLLRLEGVDAHLADHPALGRMVRCHFDIGARTATVGFGHDRWDRGATWLDHQPSSVVVDVDLPEFCCNAQRIADEWCAHFHRKGLV